MGLVLMSDRKLVSGAKLFVALSWLWVFLSGQNSARLITQKKTLKETFDEPPKPPSI